MLKGFYGKKIAGGQGKLLDIEGNPLEFGGFEWAHQLQVTFPANQPE